MLMPNGHVLFGASPGPADLGLKYFEFDGNSLIGTVLGPDDCVGSDRHHRGDDLPDHGNAAQRTDSGEHLR
jgi:hypothetical protein